LVQLILHHSHSWDLTPNQAYQLQQKLCQWVIFQPLDLQSIHSVGGIDASYRKDSVIAAVVVLNFPSLEPIDQVAVQFPLTYPYLPGLLSFREAPAVLRALEQLSCLPDVLIADGHGWAHPRRFGLACHLGVLLDQPVIGCAKSLLCGEVAEFPQQAGSSASIHLGEEILGAAVRKRTGINPMYVSVGNKVDLPSAIALVMACVRKYRVPEPIRHAHHLSVHHRALGAGPNR
jgi:deoxyribonuclease V